MTKLFSIVFVSVAFSSSVGNAQYCCEVFADSLSKSRLKLFADTSSYSTQLCRKGQPLNQQISKEKKSSIVALAKQHFYLAHAEMFCKDYIESEHRQACRDRAATAHPPTLDTIEAICQKASATRQSDCARNIALLENEMRTYPTMASARAKISLRTEFRHESLEMAPEVVLKSGGEAAYNRSWDAEARRLNEGATHEEDRHGCYTAALLDLFRYTQRLIQPPPSAVLVQPISTTK